jgi:hypothetical protein
MRVAPFGNLHLEGYLRLSAAYRSLSRPSSLLRAKASSICPFLLIKFLTLSIYQRTFPGQAGTVKNNGFEPLPLQHSADFTPLVILQLVFFYTNPDFSGSLAKRSPQSRCGGLSTAVENNGFEPLTPCLQSRCSSQLS